MTFPRLFVFSLFFFLNSLVLPSSLKAGIHISQDLWNELPSQWRGFLLDHRLLLRIPNRVPGQKSNPLEAQYQKSLRVLKENQKKGPLSPDDLADLGGLHLRLGEYQSALAVLQPAHRQHPQHFRITANLAMAWFFLGQMEQALVIQRETVRLAPGKWLPAEETLEKLFQSRIQTPAGTIDNLFGISYDGLAKAIAESQPWKGKERLPSDTLARIQALALWLPMDGKVLGQTGVLCAAFGDTRTGSQILEGAVTEFGNRDPLVMRLRQISKEAKPIDHGKHPAARFRSARPFEETGELVDLPPIEPGKRTEVPWVVFSKTKLMAGKPPFFPAYLKQLDGKEIQVDGYLQPFGENLDDGRFLLVENGVGCWWCDMPDLTGMIRIEMAANQNLPALRRPCQVSGKIRLNSSDPESHLFFIEQAEVKALD